MSDFGHMSARGRGIFIDAWGAGPFVIVAAGKTFRFEDSDQFGPCLINMAGVPINRPIGARSPFWPAWNAWKRQGRRVAKGIDESRCIYDPPRPTVVRRVAGKHFVIVEHGDPEGGTFIEDEGFA